ncbi:MAG: type II toxin-antitoxin system RelE/ParE family toxin [Ignavibacteria bacterium]|jgi:plasmid stabilization system protein ParE|nr:type II toxin-antitoxin system RelE/ParE family toxin [Ignavibacteria bacterium]
MEVSWSDDAWEQFTSVLDYWDSRNYSNRYSMTLSDNVLSYIEMILDNPFAGRQSEYGDTRSIAVEHYSIIYKVLPNQIRIVAFWDGRQNPDKLINIMN